MSTIIKAKASASSRTFIGRAWLNTVQKEGPSKGTQFLNISIDEAYAAITLTPQDKIQLWPNPKREGKQDADYRLSIVSDASQASAEGAPQEALTT